MRLKLLSVALLVSLIRAGRAGGSSATQAGNAPG